MVSLGLSGLLGCGNFTAKIKTILAKLGCWSYLETTQSSNYKASMIITLLGLWPKDSVSQLYGQGYIVVHILIQL